MLWSHDETYNAFAGLSCDDRRDPAADPPFPLNGINSLRQDEVKVLLPMFVAAATPEDWAAMDLSKASVAFPIEVTAWIEAEASTIPRAAADLELTNELIGPATSAGASRAAGGTGMNASRAAAPPGALMHDSLLHMGYFLHHRCIGGS